MVLAQAKATINIISGFNRDALIHGSLILGFVALALIVVSGAPTGLDRWLGGQIQSIPWGAFQVVPRFGSDFGGGVYGFYVVPSIAAAILIVKRQWTLLLLLAGVLILHFVMISPKQFITEYRPSPAFGVQGAGGLESFPSGHVEWATSFYGLLAYMLSRAIPKFRTAIIGAFILIVIGTMLGRIELGRHWPIDVTAGAIAGLIALRLLIHGHRFLELRGSPALAPIEAVA